MPAPWRRVESELSAGPAGLLPLAVFGPILTPIIFYGIVRDLADSSRRKAATYGQQAPAPFGASAGLFCRPEIDGQRQCY